MRGDNYHDGNCGLKQHRRNFFPIFFNTDKKYKTTSQIHTWLSHFEGKHNHVIISVTGTSNRFCFPTNSICIIYVLNSKIFKFILIN